MAPEPYTLPSQTLHTCMPLNAGAAPQFGQQSPHRFILCVQRNLGMSAFLVNTNLPTCDLPLLLQAASDLALFPISRRPPVLPQLSGPDIPHPTDNYECQLFLWRQGASPASTAVPISGG